MTIRDVLRRVRVRAALVVLWSLLLTVVAPLAVSAHEGHGLLRSVPADQAIVDAPPPEILLEFEGTLVEGQVEVGLYTRTGAEVPAQAPIVDGGVVRLPVSTDVEPGIYTIIYDVNTREPDGSGFHAFEGTLRYTLRPNGCTSIVTNVGPFTSVTAPDFASPPNVMSLAAVDKNFQQIVYASNGRELQRSVDAGCTWEVVLDLAEVEGPVGVGAGAVIAEVVSAAEVPGLAAVLVLDPADDGSNVAQPTVWITGGPGRPLVRGGTGLEPIRFDGQLPLQCRHPQPCHFAFSDAPVVNNALPTLYLLTEPAYEVGAARLFRSTNAGLDFQPAGPIVAEPDLLGISSGGPVVRASGLAPDRTQEDTVYVSTGRTVHVSFNRGETFQEAYALTGSEGQVISHLAAGNNNYASGTKRDVLAVLSADEPGAPAEAILRLEAVGTGLQRGPDLDASPLDGAAVASIARGTAAGQFLVLPRRDDRQRPGVFEYEASVDALLDIDTEGVSPWLNAQATSPLCTRWFGHDSRRLYLVDADDGHAHAHGAEDFCTQPDASTQDGTAVDIVDLPPARDLLAGSPAELAASADRVLLDPGVPRTLGYTLSRGATDVPVDIAFLFDTSGSMRDNADAVRDGFNRIVEELGEREIDAWFGLAEFKDLTIRYRRLADIQPPGPEFATALAQMQVNSGDNEPHYTALHQLATGEGLQSPSRGVPVQAGREMHWRPDAVRIVVMASDEPVFDDPDGPGFARTVAAMKAKNIQHIGMHIVEEVGNGSSNVSADNPVADDELLEQMRELSAATDAFAVRPIDCDGDGAADVQVGEPLVCTLPNTFSVNSPLATSDALAEAIADLVDDVRLERAFGLQASSLPRGFSASIRSVGLAASGGATQLLDITLPQSPSWAITFSCTPEVAGTAANVAVRSVLERTTIARLTTGVVCGTLPTTPGAIGTRTPVAAALPPAAPAPPPAPIPANAPAPTAASANAFAQSAATSPAVGAAAAPQVEQQTQQAQIRDDDEGWDLAYSPRRDRTGPETTLALGMVLAAGAGVAIARQRSAARQRHTAPINTRRR